MELGHALMGIMVISALLFMAFIMLEGGFGRLLGYRDTYFSDEEVLARKLYHNGTRTYYILFIPVWETGFWHSTFLD